MVEEGLRHFTQGKVEITSTNTPLQVKVFLSKTTKVIPASIHQVSIVPNTHIRVCCRTRQLIIFYFCMILAFSNYQKTR